jgi:hypothetical protein
MELHETVYKHKASLAVDKVMLEAMKQANPHLLFTGNSGGTLPQGNKENNNNGGEDYKMTEAFNDPEAFLKMDNSLVEIVSWKRMNYIKMNLG